MPGKHPAVSTSSSTSWGRQSSSQPQAGPSGLLPTRGNCSLLLYNLSRLPGSSPAFSTLTLLLSTPPVQNQSVDSPRQKLSLCFLPKERAKRLPCFLLQRAEVTRQRACVCFENFSWPLAKTGDPGSCCSKIFPVHAPV